MINSGCKPLHARKLRDSGWVITAATVATTPSRDRTEIQIQLVVRVLAPLEVPTLQLPIGRNDEALPMSWVVSETLRYARGIGLDEDRVTQLAVFLDESAPPVVPGSRPRKPKSPADLQKLNLHNTVREVAQGASAYSWAGKKTKQVCLCVVLCDPAKAAQPSGAYGAPSAAKPPSATDSASRELLPGAGEDEKLDEIFDWGLVSNSMDERKAAKLAASLREE